MVSTTAPGGVGSAAHLNPRQLGRLNSVLTDRRPLCSPDGRPIGEVVLYDYLSALVASLREASVSVAGVALEGSCASHVLRPGAYADVDVAISLSPCAQPREQLLAIREVVVATLAAIPDPAEADHVTGMPSKTGSGAGDSNPGGTPPAAAATPVAAPPSHVSLTPGDPRGLIQKMWLSPCSLDDKWAIFSLGAAVHGGVDLRFVQSIARPFIFSVDSFSLPITRLVSDPVPRLGDSTLISLIGDDQLSKLGLKGIGTDRDLAVATAAVPITCHRPAPGTRGGKRSRAAAPPRPTPAAVGGDPRPTPGPQEQNQEENFVDQEALADCAQVVRALSDLEHRHIGVDSEDEMATVRGGGLLKYASYLTKGFRLRPGTNKARLVRYMVTRFLMDFDALGISKRGEPLQLQAVNDYLAAHFRPDELPKRLRFLAQVERTLVEALNSVQQVRPLLDTVRYVHQYHAHLQHHIAAVESGRYMLAPVNPLHQSKPGGRRGQSGKRGGKCTPKTQLLRELDGNTDSDGYSGSGGSVDDAAVPVPHSRRRKKTQSSRKKQKEMLAARTDSLSPTLLLAR